MTDVGKLNGVLANIDDNIGAVRPRVSELTSASVELQPVPSRCLNDDL